MSSPDLVELAASADALPSPSPALDRPSAPSKTTPSDPTTVVVFRPLTHAASSSVTIDAGSAAGFYHSCMPEAVTVVCVGRVQIRSRALQRLSQAAEQQQQQTSNVQQQQQQQQLTRRRSPPAPVANGFSDRGTLLGVLRSCCCHH